ncbi:MAG TPA: S1 domain-containing RNA-binding protein [Bacillota bacterium]|nr:S1 domain-containing RNA-binding protein [Clostridiaceae bacterium]HNR04913.1 S1 domain-containing RNA-binding protein [Bacillota bacterium]HNT03630.1 S1 domain-containing RNA-binding protein [Bacillota bacterium]HPA55651.1 S1 domain-containing RNA-binding protein [Bacillota bacterium]HPX69796.1 S1 domain-containing RNA-binding protein [Bacillota bacterium]
MPIEEGKVVEGIVSSITSFGAFVQLPEGKMGLVHISEIADTYVKDIKHFIKEKDKVMVKVLSVEKNGKINLSIKQAQEIKKTNRPIEIDWEQEARKNQGISFEDRLSKFLKESDEKLQQLKKNTDSKRNGGYRKNDGLQKG